MTPSKIIMVLIHSLLDDPPYIDIDDGKWRGSARVSM
jgi:hypothetical protein